VSMQAIDARSPPAAAGPAADRPMHVRPPASPTCALHYFCAQQPPQAFGLHIRRADFDQLKFSIRVVAARHVTSHAYERVFVRVYGVRWHKRSCSPHDNRSRRNCRDRDDNGAIQAKLTLSTGSWKETWIRIFSLRPHDDGNQLIG
jgi:hypothetical protein